MQIGLRVISMPGRHVCIFQYMKICLSGQIQLDIIVLALFWLGEMNRASTVKIFSHFEGTFKILYNESLIKLII